MRFGEDPRQAPPPVVEPSLPLPPLGLPLYEVEEVQRLLRCGRTKVFELLRKGDLQGVRIGRQRLVSGDSVTALLDRLLRKQG